MKRLTAVFSILALTVSAASADAIADRKALMKERGGIVGGLSKVAKGETPFDAAAVLAQLQALAANAETGDKVDVLWAAGTETGGDTTSSPKIWEDMSGFKAAADKYKADVDAAVAAPPADVAAVGAALQAIGANCGACHGAYRIKK